MTVRCPACGRCVGLDILPCAGCPAHGVRDRFPSADCPRPNAAAGSSSMSPPGPAAASPRPLRAAGLPLAAAGEPAPGGSAGAGVPDSRLRARTPATARPALVAGARLASPAGSAVLPPSNSGRSSPGGRPAFRGRTAILEPGHLLQGWRCPDCNRVCGADEPVCLACAATLDREWPPLRPAEVDAGGGVNAVATSGGGARHAR